MLARVIRFLAFFMAFGVFAWANNADFALVFLVLTVLSAYEIDGEG